MFFAQAIAAHEESCFRNDYFSSEEFQALYLEAIDQERTNRFVEKRRMLANGLANSGTSQYVDDENKETFFRIMRDLSLEDLHVLKSLDGVIIRTILPHLAPLPKTITLEHGKSSPVLYRLQGLGLVDSLIQIISSPLTKLEDRDQGKFNKQVVEVLAKGPATTFQISQFGTRFVRFLTAEEPPTSKSSSP